MLLLPLVLSDATACLWPQLDCFCCTGTTAKPPTAGKKLTALLAKPTSTDAPSTAATPIKTPAKAPAKKAVPAGNTEGPIAQGPTAKGKGKGKDGDAEKAPKAPRAKNAYMFFMADKRDAVKSEPLLFCCCRRLSHAV